MMRVIIVLMLVVSSGCTRVKNDQKKQDEGTARKVDPWGTASSELAAQPDTIAARRALTQLNTDLEATNQSLPVMLPEKIAALSGHLPPSPDEARDWGARSFTPMDANYLGECLFFRTVARNLELDRLSDEAKARAAFAWVCRQMYLRQWILGQPMPPVPPQDALRRGYGTGLERAYTFLALARQISATKTNARAPETQLDAVLIGAPGAESKRAWNLTPNAPLVRGPFWAVGVRINDDVLLFDPWIGEPIPGPGGKGIATLSAAKSNLSFVTSWLESRKNAYPLKSEDIFNAVCYVSVPFSAFTPRMKELETKLAGEFGVRVATSPDDLAVKLVRLPGGPARWFAPPVQEDPFSPPHMLGSFTPKADGGFDPTPAGPQQLAAVLAQFGSFAPNMFVIPSNLKDQDARIAFYGTCEAQYRALIVEPGFRDRLQRGQFSEVVRLLVELDRTLANARDRARSMSDTDQWFTTANQAYEKLRLSRLPENIAERPNAEAAVKGLWGNNSQGLTIAMACVAETGNQDVAYLLALCKHEEAERSQMRAQKDAKFARKAAEDWAVARDAWARFLERAKDHETVHPGRMDHATALAARAQAMAQ